MTSNLSADKALLVLPGNKNIPKGLSGAILVS